MPIAYRNGIATLAIFRGSRRGAALRARRKTTSRGATRTLPADSGFGGRNRVQIVRPPFTWCEGERGWQGVLGGCATVLQQVEEAARRAKRVASGQSGTLRVGFVESISWHGVVPDSLRQFRERQPDAELQLKPLSSLEQIAAVRSGELDAGFVFMIANIDRELAQLEVASINLMLAAPKGYPLTKAKKLRLRDLNNASFIWFPRRESPVYYDRFVNVGFRGGLKFPHIVQEGVNENQKRKRGNYRIE